MADLVIKGKKFFRIDPTLAKILESLFPEDVQRPAAPPPIHKRPPTWAVTTNQSSDLPQIELRLATGETLTYPGPQVASRYGTLEEATAAFKKTGFELPDDIGKKFAEAVAAAMARNQAKRGAYEFGYKEQR